MTQHAADGAEATLWRCPLCGADAPPCTEVAGRRYARCPTCDLISLDPSQRPLPLAEVLRYAQHRNAEQDDGYRRFLEQLFHPVRKRLSDGAAGLDFGCGPSPVLAGMLTQGGCPTRGYDPVFAPDHELLAVEYDFVVCSEVVEHLHDPAGTFVLFGRLLRQGGLLGIMTRFHRQHIPFETWWYRRDPTHVCFYSDLTMQWIAGHHGWVLEIPAPNVAMFSVAPSGRDPIE